jgi:hypothetical protein
MRNIFIGFLFLVVLWIGWGAPLPGSGTRAGGDVGPVSTFKVKDEAADPGEKEVRVEDKSLRALRERVMNAAHRLESFPCDGAAQREMREAGAAYMRRGTYVALRDVVMNRTNSASFGDEATSNAGEVISAAFLEGVLQPEDMPLPLRNAAREAAPSRPKEGGGRFHCEFGRRR